LSSSPDPSLIRANANAIPPRLTRAPIDLSLIARDVDPPRLRDFCAHDQTRLLRLHTALGSERSSTQQPLGRSPRSICASLTPCRRVKDPVATQLAILLLYPVASAAAKALLRLGSYSGSPIAAAIAGTTLSAMNLDTSGLSANAVSLPSLRASLGGIRGDSCRQDHGRSCS